MKLRGLSTLAAATLFLGCVSAPQSSSHTKAPTSYDEQIRLDGLKRGKAMGHNPIVVFLTERGTIGITQGCIFSEGANGFAVKDNDLVINSGEKPVTITGISAAKGEAVLISGGQGRKIKTRFGGAH